MATGGPVPGICREHGVRAARFYRLKARLSGMDVSKTKRAQTRKDENAKLRRMLGTAFSTISR